MKGEESMSNNRRFVPETKMSKRSRADLNKQNRNTWTINPVSRVKDSAKLYNRKRKTNDERY